MDTSSAVQGQTSSQVLSTHGLPPGPRVGGWRELCWSGFCPTPRPASAAGEVLSEIFTSSRQNLTANSCLVISGRVEGFWNTRAEIRVRTSREEKQCFSTDLWSEMIIMFYLQTFNLWLYLIHQSHQRRRRTPVWPRTTNIQGGLDPSHHNVCKSSCNVIPCLCSDLKNDFVWLLVQILKWRWQMGGKQLNVDFKDQTVTW